MTTVGKQSKYAVNNLYATIQGEGQWSGTPMILLRLHGCPVGCPFCDTKHTWGEHDQIEGVSSYSNPNFISDPVSKDWRGENPKWTLASADVLAELVKAESLALGGNVSWCMITGGEPAQQPLGALVHAIRSRGFRINLETSGTAVGHLDSVIDWCCVSPKINMPGGMTLKPGALGAAHEIKFVIGSQKDVEKMDAFDAEYSGHLRPNVVRSLQPMSANVKATALCVQLATRRGWRVSIQTHKMMGVE